MKTLGWCCAVLLATVTFPLDASASEEAEYARGYSACENGGSSDGSNPKTWEEGCEDAKNGETPRYGAAAGGEARAREACRARAAEGGQHRHADVQVLETEQIGADRYRFDLKSPSGNIRCTANGEGEVFSTDEI